MTTHRWSVAAAMAALAGREVGGSGSAGATAATVEGLSQRSLFIRVRPAPITLSERRSVLRVLERHGKTDMFKKLADNASFIAIASTAAAATNMVKRSPIQYELLSETFQTVQPWGNPRAATLVQPIETDTAETAEPTDRADRADRADTARRQTDHVQHKSFVVSVFPSQDYHHQTAIRLSALHGPWPKDLSAVTAPVLTGNGNATYKNSFVYNALRAVVPEGAAAEGLCDWRGGHVPDAGIRAAAGRETSSDGNDDDGGRDGRRTLDETIAHIRQRKARRIRSERSTISSVLAGSSGAKEDVKEEDVKDDDVKEVSTSRTD